MQKSIAVSEDLYDKAAELATKAHVSVEDFVSSILASRLAGREYFDTQTRRFNREFERVLLEFPGVKPSDCVSLPGSRS
jgi:hypothetical protein